MCGIVGTLLFKTSQTVLENTYIDRMRDTLAHRGPDGAGTWISPDGRVGLGHRRLSIIDLSPSAAQPMSNADGTLWISFNGEIYNHAEIRSQLASKYQWKTDHSDTEVILHAFEEWGIECLKQFRGMFAIALWDARSRALWLIRDRVGIKPLCYSLRADRLTFASEIKALLEDPGQGRSVEEEALYHYLSFLTTPAPQTLFAGIKKLPPGCWLRVSEEGEVREHRYWDVWDETHPLVGVREEEISEAILAELRHAVRLRKVSDVPVGVFLSGGIDSSTNAALFADGEGTPIKTFTVGYDRDYASYGSELEHARRVAQLVGAEHHEQRLTQDDLLAFLPRMIHLQDEPIGDPVCVPVYYLSQLARNHGVTVCQVGEGSDELFFGYPSWMVKLRLQKCDTLPVPRVLKSLGLACLRHLGRDQGPEYEALRRGANGQPIFWGGADAFTAAQKQRLLSERLRRRLAGLTSWDALRPIYDRFKKNAWDKSALNWMSYVDLNLRLPELLLMRVDKMSMGVSLEGRVPFLDHKFVGLAMSIPPRLKAKNGTLKYILKKAVRGIIPDDVIDRPKQGFGVPVYEWATDRLGTEARRLLDRFCKDTDFLDHAEVMRIMDSGRRGPHVWYLLNFALWWNHYIRGDDVSASAATGPPASGTAGRVESAARLQAPSMDALGGETRLAAAHRRRGM